MSEQIQKIVEELTIKVIKDNPEYQTFLNLEFQQRVVMFLWLLSFLSSTSVAVGAELSGEIVLELYVATLLNFIGFGYSIMRYSNFIDRSQRNNQDQ